MKKLFLLILACALGLQGGELKKLTFEQAFLNRGEALLKPLPEVLGWLDGTRFIESRAGKTLLVDARSGRSRLLLDPAALKDIGPQGLDWLRPADHTVDYSRLAFVHNDDIYVYNKGAKGLRRLTATAASEKNPQFSPDGSPRGLHRWRQPVCLRLGCRNPRATDRRRQRRDPQRLRILGVLRGDPGAGEPLSRLLLEP